MLQLHIQGFLRCRSLYICQSKLRVETEIIKQIHFDSYFLSSVYISSSFSRFATCKIVTNERKRKFRTVIRMDARECCKCSIELDLDVTSKRCLVISLCECCDGGSRAPLITLHNSLFSLSRSLPEYIYNLRME